MVSFGIKKKLLLSAFRPHFFVFFSYVFVFSYIQKWNTSYKFFHVISQSKSRLQYLLCYLFANSCFYSRIFEGIISHRLIQIDVLGGFIIVFVSKLKNENIIQLSNFLPCINNSNRQIPFYLS